MIGCLAAEVSVILAFAGCAAPHTTSSAEMTPTTAQIKPASGLMEANTAHQSNASSVSSGTVTTSTFALHRAEPVFVEGFEVLLTSLRAQISHTLFDAQVIHPGPEKWNLALSFIVTDRQEGRWSRLAAPMRVLAVLDEDGRVVDGTTKTEENGPGSALAFRRGGRHSARASFDMKAEMVPVYLPQEISSFRCEIPMEVVSETKLFTLPLTDSRDEELMPGLRASVRLLTGEGPNASRHKRFSIIIEQATERIPMLRSVVYVAANGRSRELTDESRVDRLEGLRRSEFSLTTDPESGPGTPLLRIEMAIGVTPITIPFEFRDIPVGPTRKP